MCPTTDRFQHLELHVFRVHDATRSDAARQLEREPPASGTEVGNGRAVGDQQRVENQFGLLPLLAVGRFDQAEILRREEPGLGLLRPTGAGGAGGAGGQEGQEGIESR